MDVIYGTENIRYVCTLRSMRAPEEHWHITQVPYEAEFLCSPFGKAISATSVTLGDGEDDTFSKTFTVTGSYKAKPTITIDMVDGNNLTAIRISNSANSDWMEIARTYDDGEQLVINCEDETVEVDGDAVDFTGVFPFVETGENTLTITLTKSNGVEVDVLLEYTPTFL